MKRAVIAMALMGALTLALPASVAWFGVSSIREQTLASHERIQITIDTSTTLFPFSNQVGWRLMFSRYSIGDQDPQYEYAVWVLPAQSADLSQVIWFVRPAGLTGTWHYRIDAVDSSRAPLASSGELEHDFARPAAVLTGIIPYVAQDRYWGTALALTNPTDTATAATLTFYTDAGDPYPANHGSNALTVDVPARGTWSGYLGTLLPASFAGQIRMESPAALSWIAIISYDGAANGMIQQGVLNAESTQ